MTTPKGPGSSEGAGLPVEPFSSEADPDPVEGGSWNRQDVKNPAAKKNEHKKPTTHHEGRDGCRVTKPHPVPPGEASAR